jgi:hypothetical protein
MTLEDRSKRLFVAGLRAMYERGIVVAQTNTKERAFPDSRLSVEHRLSIPFL